MSKQWLIVALVWLAWNPQLLWAEADPQAPTWRHRYDAALQRLPRLVAPAPDIAPVRRTYVVAELHVSALSDVADRSVLAQTFGYAVRVGYRWQRLGTFVHVEHNLWRTADIEDRLVAGALNVGVGWDFLYADGFVRTSVALGPSILLYDTFLDRAGEAGLFFDLRPLGLRWVVHEQWRLGLDPITFTIAAPVLRNVPLVYVQYRSAFSVEFFP